MQLGLDRVKALMSLLGNIQNKLRVITVAGTNGKGSTIAFLESIAVTNDTNCGAFTSPYIKDYKENIRVKGQQISDIEASEGLAIILQNAKNIEGMGLGHPTRFEIELALAFWFFDKRGCDIVFLETGLGGELDATNVVAKPSVFIFTTVSVDHVQQFGKTLISNAKAEIKIVKPHSMVFSSSQTPAVKAIFSSTCQNLNSVIKYVKRGNDEVYQNLNASLAVAVASYLGFSKIAIKKGIEATELFGRYSLIQNNPAIIFDAAHNVGGVNALIDALIKNYPKQKFIFMIGIYKDKQASLMLRRLSKLAKKLVFVSGIKNERLICANDLYITAKKISGKGKEFCSDIKVVSIEKSLEFLLHQPVDEIIVICGSFSMNAVVDVIDKRINNILDDADFISAIEQINKKERGRKFCKHGTQHYKKVCNIAYKLNMHNNHALTKDVVYATGLLHDIGRSVSNNNHSDFSAKMAKPILEKAGFNNFEQQDILQAIKFHSCGIQSKISILADIIYKADRLSRDCDNCSEKACCKNHIQTTV